MATSAYNDRRKSCENVVAAMKKHWPNVDSLRDATYDMLDEVRPEVSEEDALRAKYVIGEKYRVLEVCVALEEGDYEEVGKKMYETHYGLSKEYEVSCPELDFLNDVAHSCGVTGSRITQALLIKTYQAAYYWRPLIDFPPEALTHKASGFILQCISAIFV